MEYNILQEHTGTLGSIKQDGLCPNIISIFANNFGYSWNLFYGPLSTYSIIIINFLCNNFIIAYKIFVLCVLALSGIFMYKFVDGYVGNSNVALLSGILYMTFPYHLTDLYTRNALGEYISFMFIPLVFYGLYNLFYTSDKHYYLALGAIGLILTHNISTVLVAFFAFLYLALNIKKLKESRVQKGLILNLLFILTVTSFFWAPLLETKFATNYQVYEPGMMATNENTAGHGLKLSQFFVTLNDGSYVFELGIHFIIILAFSIMAFRRVKEEIKETYGFFLIAGVFSLWMCTKYFPWKFLPQEMCIIQFPWRCLMMTGFFFSPVCAINIYTLVKKFNTKDVAIISIISIIYISALSGIIPYNANIENIEDIELGKISGSEYETVAGVAKAEYLPVNAYKDRFYIATREDNIYVLSGKALIENEEKDGTHYKAKIKTYEAEYTIFELPYIYYPGYEVRLDGMLQETFETENGFLGIAIGKEDEVDLEVNYAGTTTMHVSNIISMVSFMLLAIYVWKKH